MAEDGNSGKIFGRPGMKMLKSGRVRKSSPGASTPRSIWKKGENRTRAVLSMIHWQVLSGIMLLRRLGRDNGAG